MKKNFKSKIREYAGPRTVNRDWVRVCCILYRKIFVRTTQLQLTSLSKQNQKQICRLLESRKKVFTRFREHCISTNKPKLFQFSTKIIQSINLLLFSCKHRARSRTSISYQATCEYYSTAQKTVITIASFFTEVNFLVAGISGVVFCKKLWIQRVNFMFLT